MRPKTRQFRRECTDRISCCLGNPCIHRQVSPHLHPPSQLPLHSYLLARKASFAGENCNRCRRFFTTSDFHFKSNSGLAGFSYWYAAERQLFGPSILLERNRQSWIGEPCRPFLASWRARQCAFPVIIIRLQTSNPAYQRIVGIVRTHAFSNLVSNYGMLAMLSLGNLFLNLHLKACVYPLLCSRIYY